MSVLVSEAERVRAALLRLVAAEGPITRSEIARRLGVSPATVTAITRDLVQAGLVRVEGKVPATGRRGRPSDLLGVVADAVALLGVKVMQDHVTWVLADLRGDVEQAGTARFDPMDPEPAGRLVSVLREVIATLGRELLGVGVGVPGTVNTTDGGRVTSPMFGWDDLPLGARLTDELQLPVVVDNDVNTLAMAEHLYGRGRSSDDFLTVTIGRGIGLGVFLDGALRRGARGGAGELGHTRAVPDGPRCDCGRHGCLEAVAADPALLAQARSAGVIGPDDGIQHLLAAADSDPEARSILEAAGTHLGAAIADLVNLLAPALVIVSGEGIGAWPYLRDGFEAAFSAGVLPVHATTEIVVDPWDDQNWARGAAALVLGSALAPMSTASTEPALLARLTSMGNEVGA